MNLDEMAKAEAFDELYKAIVGLERSTENVGVKVLRDCIWLRYTEVLSERDTAIGERDGARAALRGIAKRMEAIRETMSTLHEDVVDAASAKVDCDCGGAG